MHGSNMLPFSFLLWSDELECRAICQDPDIFPKPTEFRPERYLGENKQLDAREYAFGAGRRWVPQLKSGRDPLTDTTTFRMCPGIDIADTMLFLTITTALAVFDIAALPDHPPAWAYHDRFSKCVSIYQPANRNTNFGADTRCRFSAASRFAPKKHKI